MYLKNIKTHRGSFILFEGIDHSGKTTQSKMLYKKLKSLDIPVIHIRFPDRETGLGSTINDYLLCNKEMDDVVIHMLFSANRWEKRNYIIDNLNLGTTIICDRYSYSGIAYTASKGYDINWCKNCDIGLPEPDIIFYLDIPLDIAAERLGFGDERYEKLDFQEKVKDNFNLLFSNNDKVVKLNGDQNIDDLHDLILKSSMNKINVCGNLSIKTIM